MNRQDILAYLRSWPVSYALAPFRFPLHARVRWAGSPEPTQSWKIVARRYTEGDVSEYLEYLLVPETHPEAPAVWAYEPDLKEMPCPG